MFSLTKNAEIKKSTEGHGASIGSQKQIIKIIISGFLT